MGRVYCVAMIMVISPYRGQNNVLLPSRAYGSPSNRGQGNLQGTSSTDKMPAVELYQKNTLAIVGASHHAVANGAVMAMPVVACDGVCRCR